MPKISEETINKWLKDGISKERAWHISRELSRYTERDYIRELQMDDDRLNKLEGK